jgi:hypothetical protein
VATEDEIQAEIQKEAEALSAEGIETSVAMREVMLEGPAHAIAEIAERRTRTWSWPERAVTQRSRACSLEA